MNSMLTGDNPATGWTETETLVVTILDAATIFEGPETVYRYDLPGTGIVEGWALNAVVEQCAKICGPQWPQVNAEVIVDISGTAVSFEAAEILRRQLAVTGVSVAPGEEEDFARPASQPSPLESGPLENEAVDNAEFSAGQPAQMSRTINGEESGDNTSLKPEKLRVKKNGIASKAALPGWFDPFYASIAAIVLIVAVLSWWAVGRSTETAPAAEAMPSEEEASPSAPAKESMSANTEDGAQPELALGQKELDVEGMHVVLPLGFQTEIKDGVVTATGEDPNLRILLAADPLYAVPADMLLKELHAEIEADPALGEAHEEAGRLSYKEDPGDGSKIAWMTWADKDHQLSVGCHTRYEANVVQKAACRMAVESLVKKI